jgi:hypothetical protein
MNTAASWCVAAIVLLPAPGTPDASADPVMDGPAWIFLALAWAAVALLAAWCFYRVLGGGRSS